eukprot:6176114-Pleurochrysis_carterae.AAC.2
MGSVTVAACVVARLAHAAQAWSLAINRASNDSLESVSVALVGAAAAGLEEDARQASLASALSYGSRKG